MPSSSTRHKLPVLHPGDGQLKPVAKLYVELGLRRPHPSSIRRICARGNARAGRLPALHVLGAWHSTKEALAAWLESGTAAALNESKSISTIDEELRAAGLLEDPPARRRCRRPHEEDGTSYE